MVFPLLSLILVIFVLEEKVILLGILADVNAVALEALEREIESVNQREHTDHANEECDYERNHDCGEENSFSLQVHILHDVVTLVITEQKVPLVEKVTTAIAIGA